MPSFSFVVMTIRYDDTILFEGKTALEIFKTLAVQYLGRMGLQLEANISNKQANVY